MSRAYGRMISSFLWLMGMTMGSFSGALAAQEPSHGTTVTIFTDHTLPDAQWTALFAAIHSELASGAADLKPLSSALSGSASPESAEARGDAQPALMRGDRIVPGMAVDSVVTVYLHGDCNPRAYFGPSLKRMPPGALGWVQMREGRIEPFIHINCGLVAALLRPAIVGSHTEEANRILSLGVARVLLHEWVHIATQSAQHSRRGLTRAEFSVQDLMAERPKGTGYARRPDAQAQLPAPANAAHGK